MARLEILGSSRLMRAWLAIDCVRADSCEWYSRLDAGECMLWDLAIDKA